MYLTSETALFNACRTLFGKEVTPSREFLDYLQPSGAKTAFRIQAKSHHPDAHASASSQVRKQQAERFREVRQAYELIITFLEQRHRKSQRAASSEPSPAPSYWRSYSPRPRRQPGTALRSTRVPSIKLEFGMFAYYLGKVTYQQLIEALVWQRRQRPTLGVIARQWGWLSEGMVEQILAHRGQAVRFGKKAVELGHLKPQQVEALLQQQRALQTRIGQYFIDRGWLTKEGAELLRQSLERHNSQLGMRANGGSDD